MIASIIDGELGSDVRAKLNAAIAVCNSFTNAYAATNTLVNNAIVGVDSTGKLFNTGWKHVPATGSIIYGGSNAAFKGLMYNADYSANFDPYSVPHCEWVENTITANLSNKVSKGGDTLTGPLLYSGTPSSGSELINRDYAWQLIEGLDYKDHVMAATTANITLSGIQTIDTYAGSADNRILVKNQTDQKENGIYLMKSGAWTRSADASIGDELIWAVVPVLYGATQASKLFRCNEQTITIGTTNISFVEWASGSYYAGSYLSLTGSTFNIDFSTFSTSDITEGTNEYFTNARARAALSASGVIGYNSSTGAFTMAAATASVDGYLSATDFTIFAAKESPLTFSTGLTRSTNTITNNLSVGVSGGQNVIGGTGVGDTLNIKGTTANGTSTMSAITMSVGNNGATTAMQYLNSGYVAFTASSSSSKLTVREWTAASGYHAFYFGSSAAANGNFALMGTSTATVLNAATSVNVQLGGMDYTAITAGQFRISPASTTFLVNSNYSSFSPGIATSGNTTSFLFTASASTGQTTGTEVHTVDFNMGATLQHASSTGITTQRDFVLKYRTHSFALAGGVITDSDTFHITGAPAAGTNATITRAWAARFVGNFAVNGKTYLGAFGSAPTSTLDIASISNAAHLRLIANASAAMANDGEMIFDGTNLKIRIGGVDTTIV
jgi:hypothetical protein